MSWRGSFLGRRIRETCAQVGAAAEGGRIGERSSAGGPAPLRNARPLRTDDSGRIPHSELATQGRAGDDLKPD
jgi:hypothetical protein